MKPLAIQTLLGLALGSLLVGAAVSLVLLETGSSPPIITPFLTLMLLMLGVWQWVAGRAVKRLKGKERTWMTPIGAARTAVFARASAYVSAILTGLLIGVGLVGFTRLWAPATAMSAWTALAGAIAAAFATVVSVVVERWCIDDDEDKDSDRQGPNRSAPRPSAPRA